MWCRRQRQMQTSPVGWTQRRIWASAPLSTRSSMWSLICVQEASSGARSIAPPVPCPSVPATLLLPHPLSSAYPAHPAATLTFSLPTTHPMTNPNPNPHRCNCNSALEKRLCNALKMCMADMSCDSDLNGKIAASPWPYHWKQCSAALSRLSCQTYNLLAMYSANVLVLLPASAACLTLYMPTRVQQALCYVAPNTCLTNSMPLHVFPHQVTACINHLRRLDPMKLHQ